MLLKKIKILKKFFLFYVLFSLMGFQDDNKIIWSKDIKLSWDDFKGNPIYVQGKGKRSRSVGAKSYVGIYCNLKYNYDAEKCMYSNQSVLLSINNLGHFLF